MGELSKKCSCTVLAGTMVASQVTSNLWVYCSPDDLCRSEVADLAHVHQQERNQWDPAPRQTVAVLSTTAATGITPIVLWRV